MNKKLKLGATTEKADNLASMIESKAFYNAYDVYQRYIKGYLHHTGDKIIQIDGVIGSMKVYRNHYYFMNQSKIAERSTECALTVK